MRNHRWGERERAFSLFVVVFLGLALTVPLMAYMYCVGCQNMYECFSLVACHQISSGQCMTKTARVLVSTDAIGISN